MNTKLSPILAIGALSLALAACNNDRADDGAAGLGDDTPADALGANDGMAGVADGTAMNDPAGADALGDDALMDGTGAAGMTDPAAGNVSRDAALAMVMAVDQHEIAAAEQAQGKQLSGEAAEFAETLLEDHTRNLEATRDLMGLEDSAAEDVPGADDPQVAQMREKHADERERLGQMEGDEYQRAWVEAMVAGHTEALDMLDNQLIPAATEDDLREHLQNTREAIAGHLETAQQLRDNQDPAAG